MKPCRFLVGGSIRAKVGFAKGGTSKTKLTFEGLELPDAGPLWIFETKVHSMLAARSNDSRGENSETLAGG